MHSLLPMKYNIIDFQLLSAKYPGDFPEILHEGQEWGGNDLYEVKKIGQESES